MAILRVMLHGVEEEDCGKNKSCPHRRDRIGLGKDGGGVGGLAWQTGLVLQGCFVPQHSQFVKHCSFSVTVRDTITT